MLPDVHARLALHDPGGVALAIAQIGRRLEARTGLQHHNRRAARPQLAGGQAAAEGEQGLRPAGRPRGEHNAGRGGEFGPYGERKRFDFFVRQLLDVTPPSWNDAAPADRQPGRTSAN
jgi:hypothetical protein